MIEKRLQEASKMTKIELNLQRVADPDNDAEDVYC
jgi:hypothetical protein